MASRAASTVSSAAIVVAAHGAVRDARADDEGQRCAAAYANAQVLRQQGKLLDARNAARACASPVCPVVAWKDCAAWVEEIDREIPTVVVLVRDVAGHDLRDVRVSIDGILSPSATSGGPLELDPGDHVLQFERAGSASSDEKVTVHQGERDRLLPITMPGDRPMAAGQSSSVPPRALFPIAVAAGMAVATLGTSAYLGLTGMRELSDLRGSCAPGCTDDQVNPVRVKLLLADVALGAGILATGIAAYLVLRPIEARPSHATTSVDVVPTRGGAAATLCGSF